LFLFIFTLSVQEKSRLKQSTSASPVTQWREHLHYRLKEVLLIALAALCLYTLMALLTYDPSDPGWTHTSRIDQIHNAAGRAGAWLADVLFMALGYFAFIFPLLLGVKTWQVFRHRYMPWEWSGWLFSWRLTGLVFLILAGSALAYIHFHADAHLPASAGGALGESLGQLALSALNVQGSTLLFLAVFLLGLTVFTDLSWFKVMDLTGKITLDLFELIQGGASRWVGNRSERKRLASQLQDDEEYYDDEALEVEEEPQAPIKREPKKAHERIIAPLELDDEVEMPQQRSAPAAPVAERAVAEKPQMARPAPQINIPTPEPAPKAVEPKRSVPPATHFVDSAIEGTIPPISLLDPAEKKQQSFSPESLESMSRLLEIKLKEFGVEVIVESVHPGPVITRFEIQPAAGVKVSRISNLAKDLARSLAVFSVRVVEVIPGKTTVGIEIPNEDRQMVRFSEVLESAEYEASKSPVTLALGHDIGGRPVIADLAKMPHLLGALDHD
jgi:S-DNA-T family DNA segregation ATPase FtsK/SpoIIIE